MKGVRAVLASLALVMLASCNASTAQKLSQASDAFSKAMLVFQQGEQLAVKDGKISPAEDVRIQGALIKVGVAGKALNKAIRANESAPSVSAELNNVIDAVNSLIQDGVLGIKDANTQQSLSLALTGAEAAISVVASVVGSKSPAASAAGVKPTSMLVTPGNCVGYRTNTDGTVTAWGLCGADQAVALGGAN